MRARTFAALLALLLFASPLAAQETRGSIEGIVKDSSGAVLPGVTVEAKGINVGATATTVTDASGVYRFPVAARRAPTRSRRPCRGSTPRRASRSTLQLGQVLKVDVAMQLVGVSGDGADHRGVAAHRRQAERGRSEHPRRLHRSPAEGPRLHDRSSRSPPAPTTRAAAAASRSTARRRRRTATSSTAPTRRTSAPASRARRS